MVNGFQIIKIEKKFQVKKHQLIQKQRIKFIIQKHQRLSYQLQEHKAFLMI